LLDGRPIGWLGCLHPKWQQHYQLARGVVLFELELAALTARAVPGFSGVAKFPPVRRDLALVVDQAVPAQSLQDAMLKASSGLVNEVTLFDQYTGKGVPEGKKSLAFLVVMQDTQRTLTDNEVDAEVARLVTTVASAFGAGLRS
jgi:phenylalanyl-tRNA synthetase beta chain